MFNTHEMSIDNDIRLIQQLAHVDIILTHVIRKLSTIISIKKEGKLQVYNCMIAPIINAPEVGVHLILSYSISQLQNG